MAAKRRPSVRQLGWVPPGHGGGADLSEPDRQLVELVDLDDPACWQIICAALDMREFGIELDEEMVQRAVEVGRARHAQRIDTARRVRAQSPLSATTIEASTRAVVYYMRIGNRVKIGFTTSLAERLRSIHPEELLAVEPGGYELEQQRHAEFCRLRTHGEWFKLEMPLTLHIAALQGMDNLDVSA